MKKILLTIALITCAVAGQAQFVVSMHLNGIRPTYNQSTDYSTLYHQYNVEVEYPPNDPSHPIYHFNGYNDSVVTSQQQYDADKYIALGGGLKIGYQVQRLQFGISGNFNWHYTTADQDAARYLRANPNCDINVLKQQAGLPDTMILEQYTGWLKEYYTSFTIAPYVRFEMLQAGDIALFVEANGFFSKVNKPKHHDYLDWYHKEMHHSIDTTFDVDHSTISYGALVTPGLSWQLSPHCLVDLYFDFLAIGYRYTKETTVDVYDEYDYTATPRVLSRRTTVTTTVEDTHLGFDLQAAPMSNRNYHTWVRVGFSYTF